MAKKNNNQRPWHNGLENGQPQWLRNKQAQ